MIVRKIEIRVGGLRLANKLAGIRIFKEDRFRLDSYSWLGRLDSSVITFIESVDLVFIGRLKLKFIIPSRNLS